MSSSLWLFPHRFGRHVLRPSSSVCRTLEPTWNFELRLLLNPLLSPVLIPLAITEYKCYVFLYCYSPAVRIEPATSWWLSSRKLREPTPITVMLCVCVGSRVRQTHEEGRRTYRPKRSGNNNKDEENCPKSLNDMNFNQLYINQYFESSFAIHQMSCWFLSSKIQQVSSSGNFSQISFNDLIEKLFCYSQHLVENETIVHHLVILAECDLPLSWRNPSFILLMSAGYFLWISLCSG